MAQKWYIYVYDDDAPAVALINTERPGVRNSSVSKALASGAFRLELDPQNICRNHCSSQGTMYLESPP